MRTCAFFAQVTLNSYNAIVKRSVPFCGRNFRPQIFGGGGRFPLASIASLRDKGP